MIVMLFLHISLVSYWFYCTFFFLVIFLLLLFLLFFLFIITFCLYPSIELVYLLWYFPLSALT